jgi:hypothetical protein
MANVLPLRWTDFGDYVRKVATTVNGVLDGRVNNVGSVTLADGETTTVVTDLRAGIDSVITLTPTTANASAEFSNGTIYISARGKQTFTLTHADNGQTDRTYLYAIIGSGSST